MPQKPAQEEFLKSVSEHKMTVLLDRGTHRHLHFSNGSFNQHFILTTWPGYLCISGDMGCYVFRRLKDMFCFFRGEGINVQYWAEKCEAESRAEKMFQYSARVMSEHILELQAEGADVSCMEDVDLRDETEAREALAEIEPDQWECDFTEPTYHFVWCLRAIVWGIQQYDLSKQEAA